MRPKKGGPYSNLGRKNPRKNNENPEQSWKFREGLKIWKNTSEIYFKSRKILMKKSPHFLIETLPEAQRTQGIDSKT